MTTSIDAHQVLVNYHHMVDEANRLREALEELRTTGNVDERNRIIDEALRVVSGCACRLTARPCPTCRVALDQKRKDSDG